MTAGYKKKKSLESNINSAFLLNDNADPPNDVTAHRSNQSSVGHNRALPSDGGSFVMRPFIPYFFLFVYTEKKQGTERTNKQM